MKQFKILWSILIIGLLTTHSAVAKKPSFSISTGYVYGDREDDLGLDTDVEIIPLTLSYKTKQWKFKVSTAYLKITGPGDVVIEGYEDGNTDIFVETTNERKGMGDTFLSLTYSPEQLRSKQHKISLGYKYKAPTGDEDEGLSSGEADHHIILRGYYRINRVMLLGRIGYQIMGDTEDRDYNDRTYAGAGIVYIANRTFSFGTQYYTKEASTDERDDLQTVSGILQYRPNKRWSAALNVTKGLTDTTLDQQVGLQIRHRF